VAVLPIIGFAKRLEQQGLYLLSPDFMWSSAVRVVAELSIVMQDSNIPQQSSPAIGHAIC